MSSEHGYVIIRFDSRDDEGNTLIGILRGGLATGHLFELFGIYRTRKAAEEDLLANGARKMLWLAKATLDGTVTKFLNGWARDDEHFAILPTDMLGVKPSSRRLMAV